MIRHVVVITWRDDATAEQRQQARDELATLPPLMRGLVSYTLGPDIGVNQGNADLAIVADFDDVQAYQAYRDHPAHVEVVSRSIAPIAAQRRAVQFEI
ncbi:MAG TPA: Dabb family protein [Streptosporangiaceae bacterium]|nr:Dabb family protein [Streptosporangiaceae bacterium]